MRRALDGVLLLDKPCAMTSNAALQQARRLLGAAKAGHGGTLDPLASGLLLVVFGEATKFARFALEADKTYLATVRLGITTATGDAEGEILSQRPVRVEAARLAAALERFRGEIEQVPPIYSALKRDGRPLYALARAGGSVERAPRRVRIEELALLERSGEMLRLRVRCSKGTYVRQLAADLGAVLGCGAHLAALRRIQVGGFDVEQALGPDALAALSPSEREARLLPLARLVDHLPDARLGADNARRFAHGQAVAARGVARGHLRVLGQDGMLLGVGAAAEDGMLRPVRLLAAAARAASG